MSALDLLRAVGGTGCEAGCSDVEFESWVDHFMCTLKRVTWCQGHLASQYSKDNGHIGASLRGEKG